MNERYLKRNRFILAMKNSTSPATNFSGKKNLMPTDFFPWKISALPGFPIYLQLCLVESLWELDLKVVFEDFDEDPERYSIPC